MEKEKLNKIIKCLSVSIDYLYGMLVAVEPSIECQETRHIKECAHSIVKTIPSIVQLSKKEKNNNYVEINDNALTVYEAALIWASHGKDEDYTYGYTEEELEDALNN